MRRLLLISLMFLSSVGLLHAQDTVSCDEIFEYSYAQWEKMKNVQYRSAKVERQDGEMVTASFDFTIQPSPFKAAGRMHDKGHYILYDTEQSSEEAWYISNGFPFTNLSLDINGKIFRGLNHYTISDAGCNFIFSIIRDQYELMGEKFYCRRVVREGNEEFVIEASADDWGFRDYVGEEGETVLDIARKLNISAYLIIERNEGVSQYHDDCGGMKLKLPIYYGKHIKLHVDAEHGLPMLIQVYDEKGLLEQYEYFDYHLNVVLPEDYFTVDHLDELD
ncbi:MAG: hypothetical protein HQ500_02105 [Flavobacteriales bacterium]|nr:hypothetical protein [Flavobacteriales bacterium]